MLLCCGVLACPCPCPCPCPPLPSPAPAPAQAHSLQYFKAPLHLFISGAHAAAPRQRLTHSKVKTVVSPETVHACFQILPVVKTRKQQTKVNQQQFTRIDVAWFMLMARGLHILVLRSGFSCFLPPKNSHKLLSFLFERFGL